MRHAGLIACLALLGACAPLTAERSLFSVADQIGPTPLTEGRWVQGGDGCAPGEAASEADACVTVDVARDRDGAWLYTMRSSADEVADSHWRFIIAPATETARGEDYAPLYLAEYNSLDDETPPFYAVVAPVGVMPAREVRMVTMIDCDDVLREGPIPGVEERNAEEMFERLCVASDQAAVREAARRAAIENLALLIGEPRTRFLWVSPTPLSAPQNVASLALK